VSAAHARTDVVVKVGGGLLAHPGALDEVARAIERAGRDGVRLLVVPGGGPFADAVRSADRMIPLAATAAHWMAILGMDQYAHLLASRISRSQLVQRPIDIMAAYRAGSVPILAPFSWLHADDPLPHGWDVTSDSIAAWVATQLGASRLVLVKPVTGALDALVDAYFERTLGPMVEATIVDPPGLATALSRG
jgi:aspartokinase-like uncharacterized kinase